MADVFISYRKADRAKAEALAKALRIENLDVWWDDALAAGQTFDDKIQTVLNEVKAVIVLWSKESVKSEWVRAESSVGRERGVLVPAMIQDVNIPVPFNLIHTADLVGWSGDRSHPGYVDLVKQVKEKAGKANVPPLKPPPNRQLRALWRTVTVVGVIAVIGASVWVFKPWEALRAKDPVVEAQKVRETSLAKLTAYGITRADLETFTGRHIARKMFKPEQRAQLNADAASGDPSILTLKCAVDFWATPDGAPDHIGALTACEKAAATGEPAAQTYYGQLLEEGATYVGSDEERLGVLRSAADEYRKAALKGFGWSEIHYAWMLFEGDGVDANPAAAQTYFMAAQAKGLPAADFGLAQLYLSEKVATTLTEKECLAMIRKAADAGDPNAQFSMAEQLVDGWNFAADYPAALAYYKAAAAADEGAVSWKAEALIPDAERRIRESKPAPP